MANAYISEVFAEVKERNSNEPEFLQAVEEVLSTLEPAVAHRTELQENAILERIVEPERVIIFRVPWVDDRGKIHVNRGYRVQFNSAIGLYKGGLRFHPSVNLSILKFLAFEQVFKNALTTLPMGGCKGGADFDPHEKSDDEVMRFCQSFMTELYRHIGANTDVPAGDIGVGRREVGYMFGQYKRITNEFASIMTGKGLNWGGSLIRTEATGYGCVYFAENMLAIKGDGLRGKTCLVSGAGNVAQNCMKKLIQLGAKPVTCSDSNGFVYDADGIDEEKLDYIMVLKNEKRGRIREYAEKYPKSVYTENGKPWAVKADCAFPCATQNEIFKGDAEALASNGCIIVTEGANMPSTPEAVAIFQKNKMLYAPGKAANAGGVAVSGLEMSQNAMRISWTAEEVESRLKIIMKSIHDSTYAASEEFGDAGNYVMGANIAGFLKVADAMIAQGVV